MTRATLHCVIAIMLGGCAGEPLIPYSEQSLPMVLLPAGKAGIADDRGRFREVFCAVMEARGDSLPDYRSCEVALSRVGEEPPGTGRDVALGASSSETLVGFVPGLGWSCFSDWLDLQHSVENHIAQFGYEVGFVPVGGLTGSEANSGDIYEWVMGLTQAQAQKRLVLIGYSKGTPDILEALVRYPEVAKRVSAVVSIAGAVGGSPLANEASQQQANLLAHFPDSDCQGATGHGAVDDLKTDVRKQWLADHELPKHIKYYTLVTYPHPDRISSGLQRGYRKLSRVDARNDSQVIFYDQIVPGSTLLAFLNADHWAVVVPIERSHELLASTFVDENDFPREAMTEALMRYLDEALTD